MYVPHTESFKNNKNELACISHQFLYNTSLDKHPGAWLPRSQLPFSCPTQLTLCLTTVLNFVLLIPFLFSFKVLYILTKKYIV